jgi:hypothetical protein
MFRRTAFFLFALLLPQVSWAGPPKELYGKSVVLNWTEVREQRPEGAQAWQSVQSAEAVNIYVSETGRVFIRSHTANRGGSADGAGQVGSAGSTRSTFSGRSLLFMTPYAKGGAARFSVAFDPTYSSCTADVAKGKESPDIAVKTFSRIIKHVIEIRSTKVSGATCSIRSGNVFGN